MGMTEVAPNCVDSPYRTVKQQSRRDLISGRTENSGTSETNGGQVNTCEARNWAYKRKKRTLHRNMLLPVCGILEDAHQQKGASDHSFHRRQRKLRHPLRGDDTTRAESSAGENESDSGTSNFVVYKRPPTRGHPLSRADNGEEEQVIKGTKTRRS